MKMAFYPTKYAALIDRLEAAFPAVEMVRIDEPQEIAAKIGDADAFVTSNRIYTPDVGRAVCEHGKALRWVQFTTSGIDNALKHGLPEDVPVTNGAGMHARRVAGHAFALLLAVVRRANECAAARARRDWIRDEVSPRLSSLEGKTLLLVGLGAIGQDIARKAKAFDMRIVAVSRAGDQGGAAYPNVDEVRPRARLRDSLGEADAVILATSHENDTHHLIDAAALAAMKPDAVLINVARGPLVDEPALIDALKDGRIAGAGLDVTEEEPLPADSPLWDLPNLVYTPHIAGAGGDNTEALFEILSANLKRFLAGQPFARVIRGPGAA